MLFLSSTRGKQSHCKCISLSVYIKLVKEARDSHTTHIVVILLSSSVLFNTHTCPPRTILRAEQWSVGVGHLQSGSKMSSAASAVHYLVVEVFMSPIFRTPYERDPFKNLPKLTCSKRPDLLGTRVKSEPDGERTPTDGSSMTLHQLKFSHCLTTSCCSMTYHVIGVDKTSTMIRLQLLAIFPID